LAGFENGRLIVNYPYDGPSPASDEGTWVWRVIESVRVADVGKVGKARELLIENRRKILRTRRAFNHRSSWIENARSENKLSPFAAIIVDGCPESASECNLDNLSGDCAPQCLREEQHVRTLPKNAEHFAHDMLPMVRHARALRFVDPHYLWQNRYSKKIGLSKTHAAFAREMVRRMDADDVSRVPPIVEFHMLRVSAEPYNDLQIFVGEMAEHLPSRWKAAAFLWEEKEKGKRFHARYLLTDIGGVGSDYGLDEGRTLGDETDLYLLPEAMRAQRTEDFSINSKVFSLAAGPLDFWGRL
jgi:hypothetical protein